MSKSGYFLDFSQFEKNLKKILEKAIPELAEEGMRDALDALLDDAKNKPPQAPWLKGDLHGSAIKEDIKVTRNELSGKAGFNIKYATKQHEVEPGRYKYTMTVVKQPGPKFLESKMAQFKERYMELIAKAIRRGR